MNNINENLIMEVISKIISEQNQNKKKSLLLKVKYGHVGEWSEILLKYRNISTILKNF